MLKSSISITVLIRLNPILTLRNIFLSVNVRLMKLLAEAYWFKIITKVKRKSKEKHLFFEILLQITIDD